jgi:hypothetical protein
MPTFEIILKHTITSFLSTTVDAMDEEAAREKIARLIGACQHVSSAVATKTMERWQVDEEEITIEDVNEL